MDGDKILIQIQNYYSTEIAKLIKANAMLAQENQQLRERLEKKERNDDVE